jgi:hypothetical protein
MFRKLFAGAALMSVTGALLFGGAFAWQTSDSARGAALVGENAFEIKFSPHCDAVLAEPYLDTEELVEDNVAIACHTLIGPNGTTTEVGEGHGMNNGDFDLVVTGGEVRIRRLHRGDGQCSTDHFGGAVNILGGEVIPPGGEGGKFTVDIKVADDAPRDCQGDLVYYRVVVEAENP